MNQQSVWILIFVLNQKKAINTSWACDLSTTKEYDYSRVQNNDSTLFLRFFEPWSNLRVPWENCV